MYLLKVCRCCDAIVGEIDTEENRNQGLDYSSEITGNVAFTVCPHCMQELDINVKTYYQ